MGILHVVEKQEGRTVSEAEDGTRTYTRLFQVRTDSASVGQLSIRFAVDPITAIAIPRRGDVYADGEGIDTRAQCRQINCRQDGKNRMVWLVDVVYTTKPPKKCAEEISDNPLDDPPDIDIDDSRYQEVVQKDKDGNAIANSAREQPSPLPERDATRLVITITRNEERLNLSQLLQYQDAISTDSIWGFSAGQAKVNIKAQRQIYKQDDECIVYWRKTYTVEIREHWKFVMLDQGFCYLDGDDKQARIKIPFGSDTGEYPSKEVLLDGSGQPLDPEDDPVFLDFDHYTNYRAFAPLELPELE